jgi:hypothetical protein
MQEKSAKKNDAPGNAGRQADDEINQRLVQHLKANAIRAEPPAISDAPLSQRGFFAEAFAMLGLIGLMIVAYLYTVLVGKEA